MYFYDVNQAFRYLDDAEIESRERALAESGVRTVLGTVVNAAGVTLAKQVPTRRVGVFHSVGLGASPVWHVFCIDNCIAFTDTISAVGDMRMRLDLDAVRNLGDGLAWGPTQFFAQSGEPLPNCARGVLGTVQQRLSAAGVDARVGHELEFVLVADDGDALTEPAWAPYGATGLLDREAFLADLSAAADTAGIPFEQLHGEYGRNQFEFSLAPAAPVAAADSVVVARLVVGRVARRHGMRVSFSPLPFAGGVGNGAHQHVSLARAGTPLFEDGDGPHGITADGAAVIGGVVAGLPDVQGLLGGSILSGTRLAPGMWSGAHLCWGLENREAAVRFLEAGPANPYGANLEVKIGDPSANVYLASAAVLALALEGIEKGATLPAEVREDPSKWTDEQRVRAGVALLPSDVAAIVDALDNSTSARKLLGDAVIDATVATRRHEQDHLAELTVSELADRFRLAWTL